MKIALVSPYDWSYPGGVQDHIRHLAAGLRTGGHTVRILTPATGQRAHEYGVYTMGWAAPVRVNGSVARVAVAPDLRGRIRGLLRREQFDIIHIHEPLASALSLSILHLSGVSNATYVGTFHAWARHGLTSTSEWAYASARPFLGRYVRRLDGRIAVSQPACDFVSRFFPGDYNIIPNGVDLGHFRPDVAPLPEFADGKQNIVYLGRIEQRKGAKFLLRAIPRIREQYPNTRFIFAGDGPLRARFQHFIQQVGWKDVVFLGRVPAERLPALYTTADVFCAPSTGGESQGIVLLEALAAGRPVVASDIPGYRTVIRDGIDGILVPPKKHEAIAASISQLLGSPEARARFAEAGRQRAGDFSWGHVCLDVESVYLEARERHMRQRRHTPFAALPEMNGVAQ